MPVSLPWLKTRVRPLTICPRHKERSITTLPSALPGDRKSTRLNSSHSQISYAVFCLKKKNTLPDSPCHTALIICLHGLPHIGPDYVRLGSLPRSPVSHTIVTPLCTANSAYSTASQHP